MWIGIESVEKIVAWAKRKPGNNAFAMLYALSYIFMLRVPSEGLPMRVGPMPQGSAQSVIECGESELILHLRRRKNRPMGGSMTRPCWCKSSPSTCPVHMFGRCIKKIASGTALFASISSRRALDKLRYILDDIGVVDAHKYRTHDLRRGHARDMQIAGKA